MKFLCTILILCFAIPAFSQTGKLFKGTINNSKITLYLQGMDEGTHVDKILGGYKYDSQRQYILLNGYANNKGNIVLVEQASPNFSGVFLGAITGSQIKGKWLSADQTKNYPFQLQVIKATQSQKELFDKAIIKKANEFSGY
ncbi:hypothetical protein EZ449_03625 [Pedobacter frigidisoli]|uniref:DUF4369 domain-containing protein n=1 Tax=Pedobacter frigidisoli TaxID=2530455 RepID=A0A4R0P885_9SPHI|nr:hypothetical protein [Pedobacter frigidisoli]TCD12119.1 hypothetical protein EZ449_03625 [Pedobacter frigidisoli]